MQFIETIRVDEGNLHLLPLHQERMARTIREVYGADTPIPDLARGIHESGAIPETGLYKCRVIYDSAIHSIELHPYAPRPVRSLKIVEAPQDIDYHLKLTDRTLLTQLAAMKEDCDEVIILRDGLVTDTSYSNLVFQGRDALYTPRSPLLKGVMREWLLKQGEIREACLTAYDILPGNPLGITEAFMINAMMPLFSLPPVAVAEIKEG